MKDLLSFKNFKVKCLRKKSYHFLKAWQFLSFILLWYSSYYGIPLCGRTWKQGGSFHLVSAKIAFLGGWKCFPDLITIVKVLFRLGQKIFSACQNLYNAFKKNTWSTPCLVYLVLLFYFMYNNHHILCFIVCTWRLG